MDGGLGHILQINHFADLQYTGRCESGKKSDKEKLSWATRYVSEKGIKFYLSAMELSL